VYSGAIEKGSLNNNYNFCIKRLILVWLRMCIIIISLISDKISKPVSKKKTFIEASNVVDKPSKVIN